MNIDYQDNKYFSKLKTLRQKLGKMSAKSHYSIKNGLMIYSMKLVPNLRNYFFVLAKLGEL